MNRYPIVTLALLLAACGGGEGAVTAGSSVATSTRESPVPVEPPNPPTSAAAPSSQPSVSSGSDTGSEGDRVSAELLDPVLSDAAGRAGVSPDAVTVISAEFRDWPDGSMGCPIAGMLYAQVITPGYRVVVEAGGRQLDYRMSPRGGFRLCESVGAIPDVRTPGSMIPGTTLPGT